LLVLICFERKVLLADYWWLVCSERKVLLADYWWLVADKPNEQACAGVWYCGVVSKPLHLSSA
jgi:hypothetical protein